MLLENYNIAGVTYTFDLKNIYNRFVNINGKVLLKMKIYL